MEGVINVALDQKQSLCKDVRTFQGDLIRSLRNAQGMTQEDLKERFNQNICCMNRRKISQVEQGIVTPGQWAINEFSRIFNIDPSIFYPSIFSEP